MIQAINMKDKLASIDTFWDPKIVAELNGQHVKLAKLEGEFVWHHHEHEDELFLVLAGHLTIELRDGRLELDPGEVAVIPRGVEHRPIADQETHILMFEPASTLNTGNVRNHRTVSSPDRI